MAGFTIEDLTFAYPEANQNALEHLNLEIHDGEILLVCGASGCGKSTLLRHLKSVLTPYGTRTGRVLMDGRPLEEYDRRQQAQRIGYVLQHPEDQIVTDKVWHELAFGLENLGTDPAVMRLRVGEMASYFGIQNWFYRDVDTLSGGQKQLLNLASVMAMSPDTLILDEPTSQLDPIAASEFLATLRKLNGEMGITLILSEHRLEEALPMADRVAVLENGRLVALGTPQEVAEQTAAEHRAIFEAMPTPVRVFGALRPAGACPLTVRDGRKMLQGMNLKPRQPQPQTPVQRTEQPILELRECWFRYDRDGEDVLRDLSLRLYKGELFGIVGGNGSGKSTTISVLSGQNRPYRGKLRAFGRTVASHELPGLGVAALPQDPRSVFVRDTVEADLREMNAPQAEVERVVELMEIQPLLPCHPFDLSGGEQQRAAIAKVLLRKPSILLLDEPTKGMDAAFKERFGALLKKMCASGISILLVSHDIEFCARYSDRCGLFFDGGLVAENTPRAFFSGNHFYTTSANRMARGWFPDAILTQEVIDECKSQEA